MYHPLPRLISNETPKLLSQESVTHSVRKYIRYFHALKPSLEGFQKDVSLPVCLGLSQCDSISLLLPCWLPLGLLEPPALECAPRKSRSCHHLGSSNSGQESIRGLQHSEVWVQILALILSVHVGSFLCKMRKIQHFLPPQFVSIK